MEKMKISPGFQDMLSFGLIDALIGTPFPAFFHGRGNSGRGFRLQIPAPAGAALGVGETAGGPACGGNTGWHHMIYRAERYAPHLSNYAGAAGGRIFPSSAGFHTSMTFFTDDDGVYVLEARDAPAFAERRADGSLDLDVVLRRSKAVSGKFRMDGWPAARGPLCGAAQHLGGQPAGHTARHSGGRSGPACAA